MLDIKKLISQMTLEEKASLTSGADFWHSQGIERLGIPSVMMTDGPHGLRKQAGASDHLGLAESVVSTCFTPASGIGASWDPELAFAVGAGIGRECQAEDVSIDLGPGTNIKRSPLCGRNFEYYSEDPFLAGRLAAGDINGLKSEGVGASLKHFAANNQEAYRMGGNSVVDERTLREIYLPAFEYAVKNAQPDQVMCSYNRINGLFSSHNKWLLTDLLRGEWGFEGYVVSDWGACDGRAASLAAGMDLEMPPSFTDDQIVAAVKSGELDEAVLDLACERMLRVLDRWLEARKPGYTVDLEAHHKLAREIAGQTMVLLKNEDALLPLDAAKDTVIIGELAKKPIYQGGGSSHINSYKVETLFDEFSAAASGKVTYAAGYTLANDTVDADAIAAAVAAAKQAQNVIVIAGLSPESEGIDRTNLLMPANQNAAVEAVLDACPNAIVVLTGGSPIQIDWEPKAKAILAAYLGGDAIGGAITDILTGKVNPSAKLAETWPVNHQQNPSHPNFGRAGDTVYAEGIFVGYRYYDTKAIRPRFPFGHGLSYTTYEYSNLKAAPAWSESEGTLTVTVDVKNTGTLAGKEVVQLYVSAPNQTAIRPVKELKGFCKVALEPGETKTVTFTLDSRSFAYWNTDLHKWVVESGTYHLIAAASSADLRLCENIEITGNPVPAKKLNLYSTVADIVKAPGGAQAAGSLLGALGGILGGGSGEQTASMQETFGPGVMEMLEQISLKAIVALSGGAMNEAQANAMLDAINQNIQ